MFWHGCYGKKMSNKYIKVCAIALLIVLMADFRLPGKCYAGEDSVEGLRREVDALKQAFHGLEKRLSDLEGRTTVTSTSRVPDTGPVADPTAIDNKTTDNPAAVSAPPAAQTITTPDDGNPSIRERWRRITRQMNAEQVEALLGSPTAEIFR